MNKKTPESNGKMIKIKEIALNEKIVNTNMIKQSVNTYRHVVRLPHLEGSWFNSPTNRFFFN